MPAYCPARTAEQAAVVRRPTPQMADMNETIKSGRMQFRVESKSNSDYWASKIVSICLSPIVIVMYVLRAVLFSICLGCPPWLSECESCHAERRMGEEGPKWYFMWNTVG